MCRLLNIAVVLSLVDKQVFQKTGYRLLTKSLCAVVFCCTECHLHSCHLEVTITSNKVIFEQHEMVRQTSM